MHFLTNGEVMVCPASQSSASRGLTGERWSSGSSLAELRNSGILKKVRAEMLEGRLPEEFCSRCLAEENAGLESWRLKNEGSFKASDEDLVAGTQADGSLKETAPLLQQLSFRLSNRCNLKCRMCHPSSSRALYEEWSALESPRFRVGSDKVRLVRQGEILTEELSPFSWFDGFFEVFKKEPQTFLNVEIFQFSGGEPLMDRNHLELLKLLIARNRAEHITLEYASNLTILPREVLKCWKHFKKVRVSVSWDGRKNAQEYIRFPLRYDSFVKNVERLDQAEGNFDLWVNSTISLLNVWDYPLFLREFLERGFRRYNIVDEGKRGRFFPSFHILRKPEFLSLDRISPSGKQLLQSHYAESLPGIKEVLRRRDLHVEDLDADFNGILNSVGASPAEEESSLKELRRQDTFRKMSYRDYVPELDRLISGRETEVECAK
jgi:MoaA/NifB/PqqE/SkfB family radical SAM enzyme